MANFLCENTEVEKCLKKLEAQVNAAGGWLHEQLVIREYAGELSLECALIADNQDRLIFIPEKILLPLSQVEIVLSGDELSIKKAARELPPARREVFEIMLELLNLTGKIKSHKKFYPWVALANDPGTLSRLIAGRPDLKFISGFLADIKSGNLDALIMNSFFKTRYLRLADGAKMLMPFIDCANHHMNAAGYQFAAKGPDGPNLSFNNSRSVAEAVESYVRYGIYDAYDLFINYGFAEASSSFVRSVPMTIRLGRHGEISTRALLGVEITRDLPETLADLRFYLPEVISSNKNALALTHLMIPGPTARHALRRVMALFIKTLSPEIGDDERLELVKQAETQVLAENIKFYKDLRAYLKKRLAASDAKPALKAAIAMTDIQLAKLGEYEFL